MLNIEDGHYYELVEGRVRYGKVREQDREEKGSVATPVVLCGGVLVGCGGSSGGAPWAPRSPGRPIAGGRGSRAIHREVLKLFQILLKISQNIKELLKK